MQFLQWYSLASLTRRKRAGVRENRCNPREIFPAIGEIFLENPQGRVGTFPNGTDLNLSRVLANVPNQDGDKREEDARTWPRLLASFCRGWAASSSSPLLLFFFLLLLLLLLPCFPLSPIISALPCSVSRYISPVYISLSDSSSAVSHPRRARWWTLPRI